MAGFRKRTLFTRISQMLVLIICVIFLFSLAIFQTLKHSFDVQFYRTFRNTIGIAMAYLEYELDKISEMTLYLATDDRLQTAIKEDIPSSDRYERVHVRDAIKNILFNQAYGDFYLSQIELYLLNGEIIQVGRSVGSLDSEYSPDLKEKAGYKEGKDYYLVGKSKSLVDVRNIRDISTLDFPSLGMMLTYIDIDHLIDKYRRQIPYASDMNFLLVKDGELLVRDVFSQKIFQSLDSLDDGFSFYEDESGYYFVTVVSGKKPGWSFIGYTSIREVKQLNRTLWTVMILTHALLAMVVFFSGRIYVRHFTRPLEMLSHQLLAFEQNVFNISLDRPSERHMTEETNDLYRDVELAIKKIQDQVYTDYVKQMSLQTTQLQMLRSQINPHFLYNTLDSISWMAKGCGEQDIARMVVALGRLLRHSLSERRERITLREELSLLDDFLSIQKIRFQEKFHWNCDVEPGAEEVLMLPFILQPLVENAIKYGIEEGNGSLSIELKIRCKDEETIEITVCDSGRGFPEELMCFYRKKGMGNLISRDMLGVGLSNIYERIQLYYKGKGRLIIRNRETKGACSILEFPLIQGKAVL